MDTGGPEPGRPARQEEKPLGVVIRLEPPVELDTPKGRGWAILFRDYGFDYDDLWTVVINATCEIWTFRNHEVMATKNVTFGRK